MQNLSSPNHSEKKDSRYSANIPALLPSALRSDRNTPGMNIDEEYFTYSNERRLNEERATIQVGAFAEENSQQVANSTSIGELSNAISESTLASSSNLQLSTFDGEENRVANQNNRLVEEPTKPIDFDTSPQQNKPQFRDIARSMLPNQLDNSFLIGNENDHDFITQSNVDKTMSGKQNIESPETALNREDSQGCKDEKLSPCTGLGTCFEKDNTERDFLQISHQERIVETDNPNQINIEPSNPNTELSLQEVELNSRQRFLSEEFCKEKDDNRNQTNPYSDEKLSDTPKRDLPVPMLDEIPKDLRITSENMETHNFNCEITKSPMQSETKQMIIIEENNHPEDVILNQSSNLCVPTSILSENSEIHNEASLLQTETELGQCATHEQENFGEPTTISERGAQAQTKDSSNLQNNWNNSESANQTKPIERKAVGQLESKYLPKKPIIVSKSVTGTAVITDPKRHNLTKPLDKQKFGESLKSNIPIKVNPRRTEKLPAKNKLIPNLKYDDEEDKKLLCEVLAETRSLQSTMIKKRGRDQITKSPEKELGDKKGENLFKKVKLTETGKENQLKDAKGDVSENQLNKFKPFDTKFRNRELKEPNSNSKDNTPSDVSKKENAAIKVAILSKTPPKRSSCGLCGGELKASQTSILACLHKFHTECFSKHNKKKIECPICTGTIKALQSNINSSNVIPINKKNLLA